MLIKSLTVPEELPIYPVQEQVVFPHMVFPLFVEAKDMPLIDEALHDDHLIGLLKVIDTAKPPTPDNPLLGLDLGFLTPVFVLFFNAVWGITASAWLEYVSRSR